MLLTQSFKGFPTKIQVCMYRIVDYDYPFLEFICDKENLGFPGFDETTVLPKNEYDIYLLNRIILFIQETIGDNTIIDEDLKDKSFIGFIEKPEVLFVFFDSSLLSPKKDIYYKTYDELYLDKCYYWISLFNDYPTLFETINRKNQIPIIAYPCIPQNEDVDTIQINEISKFNIPGIGFYYFFQREPINKCGKKYAIFISNPYLSILFEDQHGREIWCVKTYSQIYNIERNDVKTFE